jgi:hypothetical protein
MRCADDRRRETFPFANVAQFLDIVPDCYALPQKCYDFCYDFDLKNHSVLPTLLRCYDFQGDYPLAYPP